MYSEEKKNKESSHRAIALNIIHSFGSENLILTLGKIWAWNGKGLWEHYESRLK